jgi:ornithine cyclodeaminase/alanine dehydrogenase-like protein (mu-crystallin family)
MALLITNAEVASLLTMEDAIDAVEEAFRQLALGGASMPPRISTPPPEGPGHSYLRWLMPGTIHGQGM